MPNTTEMAVNRKLQRGLANTLAIFQKQGEEATSGSKDGVIGVWVHYQGLSTPEFIPLEERPRTPKAGQRRG